MGSLNDELANGDVDASEPIHIERLFDPSVVIPEPIHVPDDVDVNAGDTVAKLLVYDPALSKPSAFAPTVVLLNALYPMPTYGDVVVKTPPDIVDMPVLFVMNVPVPLLYVRSL